MDKISSIIILYFTFFFNILYYTIQNNNVLDLFYSYLALNANIINKIKISIYVFSIILLKIFFFIFYYVKYIISIFFLFNIKFLYQSKSNIITNLLLFFLALHTDIVAKINILKISNFNIWNIKKKEFEYYVLIWGDLHFYYKKYNNKITVLDYIYGYFDIKLIEVYFLYYFLFYFYYLKFLLLNLYEWLYTKILILDTNITQIGLILYNNEKYTIKYKKKLLLQFFNKFDDAFFEDKKFWKKNIFIKKRMSYFYYTRKRLILTFFFSIKTAIKKIFIFFEYIFGTYFLDIIFSFIFKKNKVNLFYFYFFLCLKYIKSFFYFIYHAIFRYKFLIHLKIGIKQLLNFQINFNKDFIMQYSLLYFYSYYIINLLFTILCINLKNGFFYFCCYYFISVFFLIWVFFKIIKGLNLKDK